MWLAYEYTNDFNPIPPPPPPRESKRLSIMPFQTLSTKQSEVAEFSITRLTKQTWRDKVCEIIKMDV